MIALLSTVSENGCRLRSRNGGTSRAEICQVCFAAFVITLGELLVGRRLLCWSPRSSTTTLSIEQRDRSQASRSSLVTSPVAILSFGGCHGPSRSEAASRSGRGRSTGFEDILNRLPPGATPFRPLSRLPRALKHRAALGYADYQADGIGELPVANE